jgi:hypothetical protein
VSIEALDPGDAVGREQHPIVAPEEAALVHRRDVDPVAAGLERVRDLGSVDADVVVVVHASQGMHAVRAERNRRGRVGGGATQRSLERHEPAFDERLVPGPDVVAR